MKLLKRTLLAMMLLTLLAAVAAAQTSNASIVGDVTDPSGAAIPGATVTATNSGTGISREVQTNEVGAFRIYPLGPGRYEVSASTDGFKTQVRPDIVLEQAASLKVDFSLEVGAVSESVEVTGEAPMMQTQEASVGGVVNNTQIERIPVNGRNYTRLMILLPGTSNIRRSQSRGTVQGTELISVNGQRNQDNNITLDGVDNNIMMQNSPGGSPPMDSIQEFRVATNNSAEFGRSAGANVNIAIRSGTRDFHGSAYWYVRNNKFDAEPYFNNWSRAVNGADIEETPFKQNQYGIAVGGPVLIPKVYNGRDKTFWFVNWEGFRRRRGNTYYLTTPTQQIRSGNFDGINNIYDPLSSDTAADRLPFANNQIPQSQINPAMPTLIDMLMPAPNNGDLTRNYIRQDNVSNDRDILTLRVDHSLNANNTIQGRWLHQKVGEIAPNTNPNLGSEQRFDVDNLMIGWNSILSPSSVLEVKYAFNNPRNPNCGDTYTTTRGEALSAAGVRIFDPDNLCNVVPNFNAEGWFGVGGGGGNDITDRNHQFIGTLSKMVGSHSMKFGVTYTWRQMDGAWSNPSNGNAQFWDDLTSSPNDADSGNSVATMLLGYPSDYTRGLGYPIMFAKQPAWEFFFQDDWRISSKLTLNLGLRYEAHPWPYDKNDAMGNILRTVDPQTGETKATLMWAGVNPLTNPYTGEVGSPPKQEGYGRSLMRNDWNDFAPRVGLAYQINSKTVLRAGAGVFYNSTFMQESQDMRKFWPYLPQQRQAVNRGDVPEFSITDEGPSFDSTQAIGGWPQEPNKRSPYSSQWNIFLQRQLMSNITVEVGYVGTSNKKQIGYSRWNNALTPSSEPLNPRRLLYSSGFASDMAGGDNMFNSEYNALQFRMTKRFSNGLQFMGNYTYGNCMDDQSDLAGTKMQDQSNRRSDWSRCDYDIRHAFKAGYVYDLPFGHGRQFGSGWNSFANGALGGWSIEGLIQMQTGSPTAAIVGKDWANVGAGNQRPDVLRDPNEGVKRDANNLFNGDAFAIQERYTFGSSGYNTIHGDGQYIFDLSVMKKFPIIEGHDVEFRAEFFNFPNHFNLNYPRTMSLSSATYNTTRGATTERQIQFALRYTF